MPALPLALGIILLFDVLRVFLPSLITLFGRAGETPAELMGLYAALWFVLPFLAALLKPRWSLYGGAALLLLARLGLQTGLEQLYTASAGVTAGLVFLYGCARTLDRHAVARGVSGGLGAAVLIHLLLGNVDLVWRDGVLPWLGVLALCAAFAASLPQASASEDLAPSSTWFLFGPLLLLTGMYLLTPPAPGLAGTLLPAMCAAAFVFTPERVATLPMTVVWTVLGLASLVVPAVPLTVFLPMAALTAMALTARRARPPARPGGALLGGTLLFLVATFAYYAAYDLDLGFPNTLVPVAVSVAVLAVALVAARTPDTPPPAPEWVRLALVAGVAGLVALTGLRSEPPLRPKQGDTVTVIAYNIRMGFGLDGRLSLDAIADWAATKKPDVVLLSEVDRGWLLNGGHDGLARIADRLGMRFHFAPAADRVWGDAILTNLPVQVASHPLGEHDYPTGAQAQAIVVKVGERELGIVNTHLQAPPGQAPEVAAIARNLAAGLDPAAAGPDSGTPMGASGSPAPATPRPVLLAGDLNIRSDDAAGLKPLLDAGLTDPLTALGDPMTSPADRPDQRIDHLLISKGLTVVSAEVPRVPYSDHLPVVATLRLTSLDQEG
ncbi:endonuclease/exonuclease/phosphatase family protein [Nonomuraea sp. NPDC050310]|uniref:endonuclease/exonuclease/phosphatase family protein n=1 Tax=Nonomuraea sp. NPDC050310 TaxID=3154935 RepID=UPI0033C52794